MKSLTKLAVLAGIALLFPAATAQSQPTSLPIFTGGLTEPSDRAVQFIIGRARDTQGTPLRFIEKKVLPDDFRKNLKASSPGLYISALSTYRRCYPETRALGAFDFPLLARDWADARRVLNGAAGLAVAEGLQEAGIQVMNFWDGETRVISSNTPIVFPDDLKGKKVLGPRTFASVSVIEQGGGIPVAFPFAEAPAALGRGAADAADVPLDFYALALTDVQKSVLLSNHSFDPIVVAAPMKTLKSLGAVQRGFLEGVIRQATEYQTRQALAVQEKSLAVLKERGIKITALSEDARLSFRAAGFTRAALKSTESVFAGTSPVLKSAGMAQAQGQPLASYWKVFFATNREAANRKFTGDIGTGLLYGQADVELPTDDLVNTSPEMRHMLRFAARGGGVMVEWDKVSEAPFPDGFAKAKRVIPALAPVLYVHGFANSFDDALTSAARIGWNTGRPAVAFAWPSRGSVTPGDYRADQQTADGSLDALALVLERLGLDYDTVTDVDIVVHSMGARVLLGALEALAKRNFPAKPPKFRQLVLVAPDVASARLRQCRVQLTKYFDRKATLYVSDHDLALRISRKFLNPDEGDRAGLAPPVLVEKEIESIFIGPNDFSFLGHSYHELNGVIATDIVILLSYGTDAQRRHGNGLSHSGQGYYELHRLRDS
ncbi:MAG: C4-dicarboxylate-binding periplasmic protein precursor [Syntrophaceae bacterium PtaU1.Bin231]|nr:MAG: C4-dicarboxylate-binding periplasmic protein precursor [Syntrophaceae bacterium PtaU1.Bin231]